MKKTSTLLFLLCMLAINTTLDAATRKVLFIGNSYIYTNDVPNILRQLALSLGDTLVYDQSTPGGHTLEMHTANTTTIAKIFSQQWDVVIVQEQSQRPAFPPSQVEQQTYPYAEILDSLIHANNACTQTMFMMTWGYKNGDVQNCGVYPVVCTYEGMQMRLRESYLEMTQANAATVAPVGAAWKVARDSFPGIELYSTDNSHPVIAGSYLEACVLYASIFHKDPRNSTYYSTVPAADANNLQDVAAKVTLDSLNSWQQYGNYVYAGFDLSINDKTITLQNHSEKATGYNWNFGDLNTSIQATPAPHTYAQYGQYIVSLTSSNSCFSETVTDTINLTPTGITALLNEDSPLTLYNNGNGNISFSVEDGYSKLEIFNTAGQIMRSYKLNGALKTEEVFVPGIYYFYLHAANAARPTVIKASVQ